LAPSTSGVILYPSLSSAADGGFCDGAARKLPKISAHRCAAGDREIYRDALGWDFDLGTRGLECSPSVRVQGPFADRDTVEPEGTVFGAYVVAIRHHDDRGRHHRVNVAVDLEDACLLERPRFRFAWLEGAEIERPIWRSRVDVVQDLAEIRKRDGVAYGDRDQIGVEAEIFSVVMTELEDLRGLRRQRVILWWADHVDHRLGFSVDTAIGIHDGDLAGDSAAHGNGGRHDQQGQCGKKRHSHLKIPPSRDFKIKLFLCKTWQHRLDPGLFVPELVKTLAELSADEKSRLSHRAKAFAKLRALLLGKDCSAQLV
jgi:Ham1 family